MFKPAHQVRCVSNASPPVELQRRLPNLQPITLSASRFLVSLQVPQMMMLMMMLMMSMMSMMMLLMMNMMIMVMMVMMMLMMLMMMTMMMMLKMMQVPQFFSSRLALQLVSVGAPSSVGAVFLQLGIF